MLVLGSVGIVSAQEPKRFSIQRYSVLWKTDAFAHIQKKTNSNNKATSIAASDSSDWAVAGLFEIDGKAGAIIVNSSTKAVEQISADSESPSGFRLAKVHPTESASPKIEVIQNGKRIILEGVAKQKQNKVVGTKADSKAGS